MKLAFNLFSLLNLALFSESLSLIHFLLLFFLQALVGLVLLFLDFFQVVLNFLIELSLSLAFFLRRFLLLIGLLSLLLFKLFSSYS